MSLNTDLKTAIIISIFIGVYFIISGLLIWRKQKRNLIAGYKETEFSGNKKKLSKDVGIFSIVIGLIILILPITIKYLFEWTVWVLVSLIVILTTFILIKINFKNTD